MKILHVIPNLEVGGAESFLVDLVAQIEAETLVVCLSRITGPLAPRLSASGVEVVGLGGSGLTSTIATLRRLRALIRDARPDLVHAWMYHANLLTGLAGIQSPLLWSVHHPGFSRGLTKASTTSVAYMGARLSRRVPGAVVCPSRKAADAHIRRGYSSSKMVVIPNGVNVERFKPMERRGELARELGAPSTSRFVGMFARPDRLKGHDNFLQAAQTVARSDPDVHFVLVGAEKAALSALGVDMNGVPRLHVLGPRSDIPQLLAELDVVVVASRAEAFGMTLLEAAACGVPAVSTDVGAAREVLRADSLIVPSGTPWRLARAINEVLAMDEGSRRRLGVTLLRRAVEDYSLERVGLEYRKLYEGMTR